MKPDRDRKTYLNRWITMAIVSGLHSAILHDRHHLTLPAEQLGSTILHDMATTFQTPEW